MSLTFKCGYKPVEKFKEATFEKDVVGLFEAYYQALVDAGKNLTTGEELYYKGIKNELPNIESVVGKLNKGEESFKLAKNEGELGTICGQSITASNFFSIALLQLLTRIYMPFEEFIKKLNGFNIDVADINNTDQKIWNKAIDSSQVNGAWEEAVGRINIDSDLPETVEEIQNHKILPYVNELVTSGKNFVKQVNTWGDKFNDDISSYVSTIINILDSLNGEINRTKLYNIFSENVKKFESSVNVFNKVKSTPSVELCLNLIPSLDTQVENYNKSGKKTKYAEFLSGKNHEKLIKKFEKAKKQLFDSIEPIANESIEEATTPYIKEHIEKLNRWRTILQSNKQLQSLKNQQILIENIDKKLKELTNETSQSTSNKSKHTDNEDDKRKKADKDLRRKEFLENIKTSKGKKLSKFEEQTNDIEQVVLKACELIDKKKLNDEDFDTLDIILAKLAGRLDAYFKKHLYSTKVRNERKRLKALIRILQVKIKQKEDSNYELDSKEKIALGMYEKYKKEIETDLKEDGEKTSFSGLNIAKWKKEAKGELKDVTEIIQKNPQK